MDKDNSIKLYKPDERLVFNKVLDQVFLCEKDFKPKFTDFIQLSKAEGIIASLQERYHLTFSTFGGIDGTERVQIGMCPCESEGSHAFSGIGKEDYPIQSIEIVFGKFKKEINHRAVLGSILGLGIDRGKVGDILIFEGRCVVFLDNQMASDFVLNNLTYVGNSKIQTFKANPQTIFVPLENYKTAKIKLVSNRLSPLISKSFNINREEAGKLIKAKRVTINWSVQTKDIAILEEGSTISVRGQGKIVVNKINHDSVYVHIYN